MAETFSRSILPCDTGVSESNYSPRSDNEVDKDTPLNPPTLSTYLSGCLLFIQWRRQWKHELACCPARLAIRLGSATFALVCTWFEWLRASNSKQFPHMSNTSLMRRARTREKRRNSHTRYRPKYSNSGGNSRAIQGNSDPETAIQAFGEMPKSEKCGNSRPWQFAFIKLNNVGGSKRTRRGLNALASELVL